MPDRISIGNVEIRCLDDANPAFPAPLTALFPGTTDDSWVPFRQRYPDVFTPDALAHFHIGSYLVRSAGRTLLVDTGLGPNPIEMLGGARGHLSDDLAEKHVDPDEVDTVFHTHLHFDHVGWGVGDDGKPRFANARYLCSAADWEFFQVPEVQAHFPPDTFNQTLKPLGDAGVVDLIDGETVITPEITAIPTPGHTPGHMSLLISSGGEQAIVTGDAVVNPAQVTNPDWAFAFDADPAQAVTTRSALLDRIEAEGMKVLACHLPSHGYGNVLRLEGKRYWQGV